MTAFVFFLFDDPFFYVWKCGYLQTLDKQKPNVVGRFSGRVFNTVWRRSIVGFRTMVNSDKSQSVSPILLSIQGVVQIEVNFCPQPWLLTSSSVEFDTR